jgi:hypothetical protein
MPRTLAEPSCHRTMRNDQSLPLAPLGDCAVSSNGSSVLKTLSSFWKSASRREEALTHVSSARTANAAGILTASPHPRSPEFCLAVPAAKHRDPASRMRARIVDRPPDRLPRRGTVQQPRGDGRPRLDGRGNLPNRRAQAIGSSHRSRAPPARGRLQGVTRSATHRAPLPPEIRSWVWLRGGAGASMPEKELRLLFARNVPRSGSSAPSARGSPDPRAAARPRIVAAPPGLPGYRVGAGRCSRPTRGSRQRATARPVGRPERRDLAWFQGRGRQRRGHRWSRTAPS